MSNIIFRLHCPNCGKNISDDDQLCPHCGIDLDAPLETAELEALARQCLEKAKKAYESGRNLKRALSNCNEAIEYTPESAEAHNLRGLILDSMGKADEAIIAYQEAIRLDPDFANAKDNLAEIEAEYPDIQAFSNQRKNHWIKNLIIAVIICVSLLMVTGVTIILYVFGRPLLTPKQIVIFEPDRSRISTVTSADLKKTAEILTQRWRTLGYDSLWVSFTVSDNDQIIGQIPADINIELINRTKALGLVEFVDFGKTSFPDGTTVNTDFNSDYFPQVTDKKWHTIMTNSEIRTVTVQQDQNGSYEVSFVLTEKGTKIFAGYSAQNIGSYLGIIVDKVVVTCPKINGVIQDGNGIITGQYTQESAKELAAFLQTSPLPVPLK